LSSDVDAARRAFHRTLRFGERAGDRQAIATAQLGLGTVALLAGDPPAACRQFGAALDLRRESRDTLGIVECLERFAEAAAQTGDPDRAVLLWSFAAATREAIGAPTPLVERPPLERAIVATRSILDVAAFAALWEEGRELSLDEAVALSTASSSAVALPTLP
jgi:hypothetical protein